MLAGLLAGAGVGLGAFVLLRGLFPSSPPLALALTRLRASGEPAREPDPAPTSRGDRIVHGVGAPSLRLLEATGLDLGRARRDLRVTGSSLERHAVDKLLTAWVFAALPAGVAALLAAAGLSLSWGTVLVLSLALAPAGFLVPDLALRSRAAERRRDFRFALGSYLDLVVVVIAGGGGIETALQDAAETGQGWAYTEIRQALAQCRLAAETPWDTFARLGAELGVDALSELAASVGLAGEQGAKVRASLTAKATSLRDHLVAEAETEAQAATEKMAVPVVAMLFGFLIFVGYPALDRILTGL